mgnify:CR=1 FL=1
MAHQGLLNHHKAIYFFELSIKADNLNIAAMNNMANSLKNIGEFVKADQIFKKIISIDSNYINALNNYANLKKEVNDFEGAIELYKRTIFTAKKNKIDIKNFLLQLANSYQSLNNITESINVLNEILEIDPEDMAKLVKGPLKSKLEVEAMDRNIIKRTTTTLY